MRADDDPRFVEMFRRAWAPSFDLAAAVVGSEHADRLTIDAFGRVLERWHRVARGPDPEGRAIAGTAALCVRHARKEGPSVPRRAGEVPDSWAKPGATPRTTVTVDPVLRAGLAAMPPKVAVAFVLHHVAQRDDEAIASAVGTSPRRAAARVACGDAILRRETGSEAGELARG